MSGRGLFSRSEKQPENSSTNNTAPRGPPQVTWKHSWSSNESHEALLNSEFGLLPTEVLTSIFKYLSVHDLGNLSLVCRSFKMIADQDEVWKLKANSSTKLLSRSFKDIYMDWMYEKYLRNIEVEEVEALYRKRSSRIACGMRCGPPTFPNRPANTHQFVPIGAFKQHPNESPNMTIELSVDIDNTARELISLLEKASQFKTEWSKPSVKEQMITRYYRFMQLKATNPTNLLLIPTLDIEMIWQTHLLRPKLYQEDCLRLFHRVIDHSLLANEMEQFLKDQAFLDTCKLYKERFGEEYCPLYKAKENEQPPPKYEHPVFGRSKWLIPIYSYWDKTHFQFPSQPSTHFADNPFSFTEADITLDSNWLDLCVKFVQEMLTTVSIHDYYRETNRIDLSNSALKRLKKSYERFLYMATKYPPSNGYAFIHPTYAIDIIWHSHMQEPLKYQADCHRLVGYLIDHAPWPSVNEKEMANACGNTNKTWKQEFAADMSTDHLYDVSPGVSYDDWYD